MDPGRVGFTNGGKHGALGARFFFKGWGATSAFTLRTAHEDAAEKNFLEDRVLVQNILAMAHGSVEERGPCRASGAQVAGIRHALVRLCPSCPAVCPGRG